MLVIVPVQIEVPDGTTHFQGNPIEDPVFLKTKMIADYPHWFFWSESKREWLLHSHGQMPFLVKDLFAETSRVISGV